MCVFLPTLFKSSLLLKEFLECASAMPLDKLFHGVYILLRRKCVLGSLTDVRSEETWNWWQRPCWPWCQRHCFAPYLVFCFHRTSLLSLAHAQSCKSVRNRLFLVLFSGLSNRVFRIFFLKAGIVIFFEVCFAMDTL